GALDAVWKAAAPDRLVHASSQDGGASFSEPAMICDEDTSGPGRFPSLAAALNGDLLVCWGQPGGVFFSVRAADRWSVPRPLAGNLPEGVRLSHPAASVYGNSLWVMAYRQETKPGRVRVILYRGTGGGKTWDEYCTLATRD